MLRLGLSGPSGRLGLATSTSFRASDGSVPFMKKPLRIKTFRRLGLPSELKNGD